MAKPDVKIIPRESDEWLQGVWTKSSDRTQRKDIPALSKEFYRRARKKPGEVLPFFVLSQGYNKRKGTFDLFIGTNEKGGVKAKPGALEEAMLPWGLYACITVRPKLGFLWGPAIGQAKRYFYTQWLPKAPYVARNMEYERHGKNSKGFRGSIRLLFAIMEK